MASEIIVEFPSPLTDKEKKMIYGYKGEVVRCKDCKFYWKNEDDVICLASPSDNAYCSEGERREDE